MFQCFDARVPDFEVNDKIGGSLDEVFRLRVDKSESTGADTGRGRELLEKAAREGNALPKVARLGRERKAIVLAAAGQSRD